MPQYCCVPLCTNNKSGHKFPKDPQLRKKWQIAIKRMSTTNKNKLWEPGPHDVVCGNHFSSEDYTPDSSMYTGKNNWCNNK